MRAAALLLLGWAQIALATPVITPPALLEAAAPEWPGDGTARAPLLVRLEVTVQADGTVEDATLLDPPRPPFDALAIRAALQARFRPATVDGVPTPVRIEYAVHFRPPAQPIAPPQAPPTMPPSTPPPPAAAPDDALRVVGRRVAAPVAGASVVDGAAAAAVAGTGGDPSLAAQALPGVARPPAGQGGLSVFGADPAETRVLVDGVPIPALYHLGGLRGVLPAGLVGVLALTPAAFDPAYGRATGGLLEVETRAPAAERARGEIAADFLDGSALVEARPVPALALTAAARFGWLDRLLPAIAPDADALVPLSAWRDYAARAVLESGRTTTTLLALGAFDAVTRTGLSSAPGVVPTEDHARRFQRVTAIHDTGRGGRAQVWVGEDHTRLRLQVGAVGAATAERALRGGVRLRHRRGALHAGLDLEAGRFTLERIGTLGLPRRPGDPTVFGQPPGDGVAADRWTHDQVGAAAWSRVDLRLFDRLDLSPGLRVEPVVLRGDRLLPPSQGGIDTGYDRLAVQVAPRLAARLALSDTLGLRLAVGRHFQPPDPANTSAIFGGTRLGGPMAWHGLLGVQWRPEGVRLSGTAFARHGTGYTVSAADPNPPVAQALDDEGDAQSWGGQLSARLLPWRGLSAAVDYALTWSRRRVTPGGPWRRFEGEQRHVLGARLDLRRGRWRFGARGRLNSGVPRPRVVGRTWDAAHGRFDPLIDGVRRLPWFVQLDLRAEYAQPLGDATLTGFVGVLNATNHRNVEAVLHRFDYGAEGALTGLPLLAILGGRLAW